MKILETQKETVLAHLKKNKSITSWEAITLYHITRLSAVIFELRASGHKIFTQKISENNKRWAKYVWLGSAK